MDNPALYDSLSPIRYIRRVKTPTLIVRPRRSSHADDGRRSVFIGSRSGIPVVAR